MCCINGFVFLCNTLSITYLDFYYFRVLSISRITILEYTDIPGDFWYQWYLFKTLCFLQFTCYFWVSEHSSDILFEFLNTLVISFFKFLNTCDFFFEFLNTPVISLICVSWRKHLVKWHQQSSKMERGWSPQNGPALCLSKQPALFR